jgi:hypothetical protein
MRGVLLSLALAVAVAGAWPLNISASHPSPLMGVATASQVQPADPKIDIAAGDHAARVAWYRSPVWIAIGFLAAIVILLLVVLIGRGGQTTIIRS